MNAKKYLNSFGILIGVVVILIGVLCISYPADSYKSTYIADNASFGADFYTYQYQATRDVTSNTAAIDATIDDLSEKVARYAGAAFITAGLLIMIYFFKELIDMMPEKSFPTATPIAVTYGETAIENAPQEQTTEPEQEISTEVAVASETEE
ncbi:MAG: hypothetical protein E7523_11860 [Ruminococcaceae bacterium]|nr:hypothetical protein [Oscillospiraceae bacterium]